MVVDRVRVWDRNAPTDRALPKLDSVQIGDENIHTVRCLLDEVFGRQNFVTALVIKKTAGLSKGQMPEVVDFILWYARDKAQVRRTTLWRFRRKRSKSRLPGECPSAVSPTAASPRNCVPWFTTCASNSCSGFAKWSPLVFAY